MTREISAADDYSTKLKALLPAEVTGLYLFIRSLSQGQADLLKWLLVLAVVIAFVFYFLAPQIIKIRGRITRGLYSVTFLLWVVSIEIFDIADIWGWASATFFVPAIIAIWTFALPYVFNGLGGR